MKAKAESIAFDNIRLYSHNFGDFVFYKSMNFRSSYLKSITEEKNKEQNIRAIKQAAEYYLEVLFYSTTCCYSTAKKPLQKSQFSSI